MGRASKSSMVAPYTTVPIGQDRAVHASTGMVMAHDTSHPRPIARVQCINPPHGDPNTMRVGESHQVLQTGTQMLSERMPNPPRLMGELMQNIPKRHALLQ